MKQLKLAPARRTVRVVRSKPGDFVGFPRPMTNVQFPKNDPKDGVGAALKRAVPATALASGYRVLFTQGYGHAYAVWRAMIRAKFGDAYFDTEFGARLTFHILNKGKWA
jgi:hypothetical protein